ncbi:MAG: TonB-dependent receptor plug domain-containing protein [Chitinophagaceae bacterium]
MRKIIVQILCFCSLWSQAQEKNDTLKNIELPAARVKASKDKLNQKSFNELDLSVLERNNQGQDIPQLLSSMAAVVSYSDAGTGTGYSGLRIRGTDLTRINVSINGVPVNDAESQATYFVNTPDLFSSSNQIEVQKGIGSSKNGVGSFGASVSINNLDVQYKKAYAMLDVQYGSFNTFKKTLKFSTGPIYKKWISTLRLSQISSDGYIERSASNLKALQFTSEYAINKNNNLIFNYMYGSEKTGQAWNGVPKDSIPTNRQYNELGIKSDGTYYDNQTDNYKQQYFQLFFDKKISNKITIGAVSYLTKGKGYYEEYKIAQDYDAYSLIDTINQISNSDLIRQLWLDNYFYGTKLYATYSNKKLDFGFYANASRYDGKHYGKVIWTPNGASLLKPNWYNLKAHKSELNFYSMLDYNFNSNLKWFLDIQDRMVFYETLGFRNNPQLNHQLFYHFLNPKTKITYSKRHSVYSLSLGIANKEPNREDIETSVNQLPKAERLYHAEITLYNKWNQYLATQVSLYRMQYQNQLVLTGKINDVGAYTRTNTPSSYRQGLEIIFKGDLMHSKITWQLNSAFSVNRIKQFDEYIDDYDQGIQIKKSYTNTPISFSPSVVLGGIVSLYPLLNTNFRIRKLSFDFSPKYVSKQYIDNTANENKTLSAYITVDVGIQQVLTWQENKTVKIKLGIQNILNTLYSSNAYTYSYIYNNALTDVIYYFPQAGLRYSVGLQFELK